MVLLSQRVVLILLHLLLKSFHIHVHFFAHVHISIIFHIVPHLLLIVALHLSLLIEDVLLVEGVYLRLNAHLGIFLHLGLSLHLDHSCSFHLRVLILHRLLGHPHLVVLYVIVVVQLVPGLLLDLLLSLDVTELSDVVGFIQLFLDQPRFHLLDSGVMHGFL